MLFRPDAKECELIAKGVLNGAARGFVYRPASDDFLIDDVNSAPVQLSFLLDLARTPGQELTFTCIYPAGGRRLGVDRDDDLVRDFNDR
jgi:hypothetical protein